MTWRLADEKDEAFVRERQLWEAFQSRDRARMEALIDQEAIDVGPAGILSREQVLAAVEAMRIDSFELDDVRVRAVRPDLEIVVANSTVIGTYKGSPFPSPRVRSTSVWSRDDSTWRVVHRVECPET